MPLLSVFGSTAMAHFVCATFHPTHRNWRELNIGAPQLVGIHVYNFSGYLISDCHILFHVFCASAYLDLSLDQAVVCDSHYTECEKSACSCCQFVDIVSSYSDDTVVFADRLYKSWQLWLDSEDWISSCVHRFSSVKYEIFLHAHRRRYHHPVGHTHLTWTFVAWAVSIHFSTSCYMS